MKQRINRLLFSMLIGGALLSAATLPAFSVSAETPAASAQVSKPLSIIDLSELQLDGAAALVLTFNQPLDDKQDVAKKSG